jgi:hypothetical protein
MPGGGRGKVGHVSGILAIKRVCVPSDCARLKRVRQRIERIGGFLGKKLKATGPGAPV